MSCRNLKSFCASVLITFLFLAVFLSGNTCAEAPSCTSVNNQKGQCVTFEECPAFLAILKSPQITGDEIRLLQKLTCDYNSPKVCCPTNEIVAPLPLSAQVQPAHVVKSHEGQGHQGQSSETTSFNLRPVQHHPSPGKAAASSTPPSESTPDWNSFLPEDEASANIRNGQKPGYSYRNHPNFKLIPSLQNCGNVGSEDHIVGGQEAAHGSHPWMARIGYRNTETNELEFYCGGTVISERYILTAAHCTEEIDPEFVPEVVRVGEHNTTTDPDCSPLGCSMFVDYPIERVIAHERYNIDDKFNDIGLIRVSQDIEFSSLYVRPICLAFKNEYNIAKLFPTHLYGKKGLVAGWGRTKWNRADGSSTLQEVFLPILSNEECQSKYNTRAQISDKQMCAGGLKGKDSCGGDSGGPLIFPVSTGSGLKFFQLGVVSFGPVQCGVGGLPGVYSKITSYFDWILDHMES